MGYWQPSRYDAVLRLGMPGLGTSGRAWAPRPGTWESTAVWSLVVAVGGVLILAYWWPMAMLYGGASIWLASFARRRILSYRLRGAALTLYSQAVGWSVIALASLGTLVSYLLP